MQLMNVNGSMSKVIYMVGEALFSFESNLQYVSGGEFQLEEKLLMEIKEHKHYLTEQLQKGYIHDVLFDDEQGIKGTIDSFEELGKMKFESVLAHKTEKTK